MAKNVVILEDDAGYTALLQNVAESRGWQTVFAERVADLMASLEWADVALVDLDAADGSSAVDTLRAARGDLPIVAITSDTSTSPASVGADAVVTEVPAGIVGAVNTVTAPPENVVDLTAVNVPEERPWYATS